MATTLNNSGVVFPDNTTQASAVPSGYREIYTGNLGPVWQHSGNFSTTDLNPIYSWGPWFTLKVGADQNTREFFSSDSFLVHTTVADYYQNSANPSNRDFNTLTTYKAISLGRSVVETRLSLLIERLDFYPYPNLVYMKIFASTATSVTSAVYGGASSGAARIPPITGPSKWSRPY